MKRCCLNCAGCDHNTWHLCVCVCATARMGKKCRSRRARRLHGLPINRLIENKCEQSIRMHAYVCIATDGRNDVGHVLCTAIRRLGIYVFMISLRCSHSLSLGERLRWIAVVAVGVHVVGRLLL